MKKINYLLFSIALLLVMCGTGKPKIYISLVEVYDTIRDTTVNIITNEYFETELKSFQNGKEWGVQVELPPGSKDGFETFKYYYISDNNKNEIRFEAPAGFLNFMSERNYEMVDQSKSKNSISYTFKRK